MKAYMVTEESARDAQSLLSDIAANGGLSDDQIIERAREIQQQRSDADRRARIRQSIAMMRRSNTPDRRYAIHQSTAGGQYCGVCVLGLTYADIVVALDLFERRLDV